MVDGTCWVSKYSTQSQGYAQVGWRQDGKTVMVLAHRAAWEFHNGPIPPGMTVDHETCHRRACVNPAHLRVISNYENARRNRPDADPRIGRCVNGHPDELVARRRKGKIWMTCIECERGRQRRHRARRRAIA